MENKNKNTAAAIRNKTKALIIWETIATHDIYITFKNFLTGDEKLSQDFNTDFNINITISASDSDSMTPQPCQEGSIKFPQQGNN